MGKLKRELEFLERGMQRVKTKLQKLQDTTLKASPSTVGIRPKQFVDQHDYHVMKQSKVQGAYDHDRYIGPYSTIEQNKGRCYVIETNLWRRAKTIWRMNKTGRK